MAKRLEPVKKSTLDILADLRGGFREASIVGPEAALKYLDRTFEGQSSLPNGAKCVGYDLTAEACARLQRWERCAEAAERSLGLLEELEAALGHGYRAALESLTCFERGIQAHGELGDFHRALEICELAVKLDLGAHFVAKRDSLDWAR